MNDSHRPAPSTLHEEASRYALLRRLVPTLRHHMAGEFQPIGMMAALLERRLQQASPDLASLRENSSAIGNLSRNAAETCVSLMGWVAPRAPASVRADTAVTECVNLLSTSLRFRGFAVSHEVTDLDAPLACNAVRSVLTATLLALSDSATQPADLVVRARREGAGQVLVEVQMSPADRSADNGGSEDYRPLTWDDVACLAAAESVQVERSEGRVQLRLAVQAQ